PSRCLRDYRRSDRIYSRFREPAVGLEFYLESQTGAGEQHVDGIDPEPHPLFWNRAGCRVPFAGWQIPPGRSAVVEVYPSLWRRSFAREDRTGDQQGAYAAAAWLRKADLDGSLAGFLNPFLTPAERTVAQVEHWLHKQRML
ncbi:MAG: hypothetical protein R6V60_12725, partial [Desulfobacterales bacterium]